MDGLTNGRTQCKTAEALVDAIIRCLETGDDAAFRGLASAQGLAEIDAVKFSCAKPQRMTCEFKALYTEVRYVPWDDIYDGTSVIINVYYNPGDKANASYVSFIYKLSRDGGTGDWFVRGVEKTGCEIEYDFVQTWKEHCRAEGNGGTK